ncbi:MAG TPA: methyltransferase [Actinophytocola sp.]|uniref:methyltransferase n=1 Tax=Actinophytocola sp. TaxID=1872138 RepID=UPI002F9379A0
MIGDRTYWRSRMVAVATELDLRAVLPATLEEVCARLGLHPRPAEALLNGLCAMGFLARDGAHYRAGTPLPPVTTPPTPPTPLWTRLRPLLETGEPQGLHAGLDFCPEEEALRRFVAAGEARSTGCGPALAAAIDWREVETVVDLGGARGGVLAHVLRAHPHLRGASFDLPAVRPLFDEHVADLADRMWFHGGDFFADELPEADVYVLGNLLSDWDDDRCAHLVERAVAVLPPGGMLLLYDALLDPDRPETEENWVHALVAQLIGPGGTVNTTDDCRAWFAAAGLTDVEVRPLTGSMSVVLGTKPGRMWPARTPVEER